jgi:hypothetical protein
MRRQNVIITGLLSAGENGRLGAIREQRYVQEIRAEDDAQALRQHSGLAHNGQDARWLHASPQRVRPVADKMGVLPRQGLAGARPSTTPFHVCPSRTRKLA